MHKILMLASLAFIGACIWQNHARAETPTSQPATATFINGQTQSIPAQTTQWYKFDYAGDKSLVTILMPNGTNSLVEFNVFTPEQAQNWWDPQTKPVGRGTAYSVDCATGEEVYWGECKANDLKWKGQFNFPGTFYVQVINRNTGTANFTLTIQGTGVSVGTATNIAPPPQQPPLLPVTGAVWNNAPPLQKIFDSFRRE